jgi:hypothetical protein
VDRVAGEFESSITDDDLLRLIRAKGNDEPAPAEQ